MDVLTELAAAVGRDPTSTATKAGDIAREARAAQDWGRLSRAQAIRGRALRMLGEIDLAMQALEEAIAAADRVRDTESAADAHLALAGALSIAGKWATAFAHLDIVAAIGSEEMQQKGELQRAAICRDVGRVDEALQLFERAIPRLRRQSQSFSLALALANCGGIRIGLGEARAAIPALEESIRLFRDVDQEFAALQATHDLACAYAVSGDLPTALLLFDDASAGFIELGSDASLPLLSRAEALLVGGLSADALALSQDAARRLFAEGNHFAASQALVAVAEAARLEGDYATAVKAATRAHDWFATSEHMGWARAAELEAMSSRHAGGSFDEFSFRRLESLAEELSTAGDVRNEVLARALAAIAACELGLRERAEAQSRLAASAGRRSQLWQTRLSIQCAVTKVRLERGDLVSARRELKRALELLATTRRMSGTTDAGAAVIAQARTLTTLAGDVAALESRPMRALEWMERARIAAWPTRPSFATGDTAAEADFVRLRTAANNLRRAELAGEPTGELRRSLAGIENAVRTLWLKQANLGRQKAASFKLGALADVVGSDQVVSLAASGKQLIAVVANRRRTSSHVLGDIDAVLVSAEKASRALRGMCATGVAPSVLETRRRAFDVAVTALDSVVLAPLRLEAGHIVLVVPPDLHGLPWAALPSLQGRSFTLAPSVNWWIEAKLSASSTIRSALVVAGPRLADAEGEARSVGACHGRATVLTGQDATVANVRGALADHDLAHFVAHGAFRRDNPLWSTIELADGQLTVYELERLGKVPSTVVLATCESGVGGVLGGTRLHGLASTLLTMGARTIVAAVGALPDTVETRRAMVALHRDLADGVSASSSLARRRTEVDGSFSVTSASLVTLGVG